MKATLRVLLAVLFILAGVLHFTNTALLAQIIPPYLPAPSRLVQISGGAEIVGGIGLLIPATRWWAGIWTLLLLVAVLPANIFMAMGGVPLKLQEYEIPQWAWWTRIVLQPVLMLAVAWVAGNLNRWSSPVPRK